MWKMDTNFHSTTQRGIGIYAMSPSLLPYYIIFWPGALPSTFDLPKQQEAKYQGIGFRVQGLGFRV